MVDKTPAELDPGITSDTSVVHSSENNISTNSKGHNERDISRLQGVAQNYSSSKTYNVNDMVTESEIVYRCISSIAVPEVFNIVNWTEINAEDTLIFVRNVSGVMIPKGSAVYITGADSGDVTIDLAEASGVSTVPAIGITQDNISNNNTGEVVRIGHIDGLNTSTFSEGDTLFLSATTPGGLTSTQPLHPNLMQKLAIVLTSDLTLGEIEVLTGDVSGAESGTISNSFVIGDGLTGTKSLRFLNNLGTFNANVSHTGNRNQSFQDLDGTIALTSDLIDTTASNVGSGSGVFKQKIGSNLEFRSLVSGFGISLTQTANEISIENTQNNKFAMGYHSDKNWKTTTRYAAMFTNKSDEAVEAESQSIAGFAYTVKSISMFLPFNTSIDSSDISLKKNSVVLPATTITIPPVTTGHFTVTGLSESFSASDEMHEEHTIGPLGGDNELKNASYMLECES